MDWFKKHVDTVVVLGAILSSVLWMNGKFNDIDLRFKDVDMRFKDVDLSFKDIDLKFKDIEKEIYMIKACLIMKHVIPAELAKGDCNEDKN